MRQTLKRKSDLHIARKIWHVSAVLMVTAAYVQVDRPTAIQLISIGAFIFIANDVLRQRWSWLNQVIMKAFQPVMREYERDGLAGTTYLLAGVFIIIMLFPKPIVTLSLLFLAIADPLASYVGILYGKDKIVGQKSLQGSFAAFAACTITASVFFFSHNIMTDRILIVSLVAGTIGALAELIPIGRVDDNFTFPVTSASMLWVLFYLFGGFGGH